MFKKNEWREYITENMNIDETKNDYNKLVEEKRKETLVNKKLYGKFLRNRRRDLSDEKLW